MTTPALLLFLVTAHLLYDFHIQGTFVGLYKGKSKFVLFLHALTWALVLGCVLWFFHALLWWHIPFLLVTHFIVDFWKSWLAKDPGIPELIIDQTLHMVTILSVWVLWNV